MFADLLDTLRPALADLLQAAAIALLVVGTRAILAAKAQGLKWLASLSADRRWTAAIARLDVAALAAVDEVEQRMGAKLRALEPNAGKLSADQAQRMLGEAVTRARMHFGPEAWAGVLADLGLSHERALESLATRVESAVRQRKLGHGALVALEGQVEAAPAVDAADASTVRVVIAPERNGAAASHEDLE
jgi:hypothetical protein